MWHHEGFLFIWSCEQLGGGKEHDEAALILIDENYLKKEKELKVVGPKYLGQSFWGAIDWGTMSPSADGDSKSPVNVSCPFKREIILYHITTYGKILLPISISILVVLILVVKWAKKQ